MTDELKKFLTDNKNLLIRNDFDSLYKNCRAELTTELNNFLFNVANINPFDYMSTALEKVLNGGDFKKELIIPKNITLRSSRIFALSAPSVILQCNPVPRTFIDCNIRIIRIADGVTKIPSYFLRKVEVEKIYVPKSVSRIGNEAFEGCSSTVKIITPYRDNPQERLIVPKNEVGWYKEHLKFTHAPKENEEEVQGE